MGTQLANSPAATAPQRARAVSYTHLTSMGVEYAFNSKLKAYTEYKIQGLSQQDDEWTVGMQYNF